MIGDNLPSLLGLENLPEDAKHVLLDDVKECDFLSGEWYVSSIEDTIHSLD